MTTHTKMRENVVTELFRQLEQDTSEFRQWVDEHYKYYSPTGERLGDYAGSVQSLTEWLKDEVEQAQTTINAYSEAIDYRDARIKELEAQLATIREAATI